MLSHFCNGLDAVQCLVGGELAANLRCMFGAYGQVSRGLSVLKEQNICPKGFKNLEEPVALTNVEGFGSGGVSFFELLQPFGINRLFVLLFLCFEGVRGFLVDVFFCFCEKRLELLCHPEPALEVWFAGGKEGGDDLCGRLFRGAKRSFLRGAQWNFYAAGKDGFEELFGVFAQE